MSSERLMRIHSAEFQAMAERVLRVTELTSRLNVLPFEDEVGKAALFEQILGRPLPARVTIYPPFYTDHAHAEQAVDECAVVLGKVVQGLGPEFGELTGLLTVDNEFPADGHSQPFL